MKSRNQEAPLDELDWSILRLLQENAKQTYKEIGNKLSVAHSTVYDRIQRMEEHGFIKKYEAVVDSDRIGLQQITAQMIITTIASLIEFLAIMYLLLSVLLYLICRILKKKLWMWMTRSIPTTK